MRKKCIIVVFIVVWMVLVSTGCLLTDQPVNLLLMGMPRTSSYTAVICTQTEDRLLDRYVYKVDSSQTLEKQIRVNSRSKFIVVYLFRTSMDKPSYFWVFTYDKSQKTYTTKYWLDYERYNNYDIIHYGASDMFTKEIDTDYNETMDFDIYPYYLYKFLDLQNKIYSVNVTTLEGRITYPEQSTSIDYLSARQRDPYRQTYWMWIYSNLIGVQSQYLVFRPERYDEKTIAKVEIKEIDWRRLNDDVTSLIPTENPAEMWGLTGEFIYRINPITRSIEAEIPNRTYGASHMAYSQADRKLYLTKYETENLDIFDIERGTWDTMAYALTDTSYGARDIVINSPLRRIYISSYACLYIIDMDSYRVIQKIPQMKGEIMAIDTEKQVLYIKRHQPGIALCQYLIQGDTFILQNSYTGTVFSDLVLSPDGTQLAIMDSQKEGVISLHADDLSEQGRWDIGGMPRYLAFSPDGSKLYGLSKEDSISVMDAKTYSLIGKKDFPCIYYPVCLGLTADSSVLVGYSTFANGLLFYDDLPK